MSPKNSLLNVGLTALGWFGFASSSDVLADPGSVPPPGQTAAIVAAPTPTSASGTVLSLFDGRVLQGKIQVDGNTYALHQNGGVLRFRKEQVEGVFASIAEVYRFKAERVPERDPDEHMKLADWCLTHHLNAEAKSQLLAVLELIPNNASVKNRIGSIDNALARTPLRDGAIQRTRGERPADAPPAELDPQVFGPGRAAPSALGLPLIFDLPTPLAVKRADEFSRSIHAVLQRACAGCHNEKYQGSFQLIHVRTRKDLTPTVERANLESTLRLIDPESPSRSELLTRSLIPHGPYRKPIFGGATDPNYQRVAAWVGSLRQRTPVDQATATRFGTTEPAPAASASEGFATDRTPRADASALPLPRAAMPDGRPQPPALTNPVTPLPPGQFVAGSGTGVQPYAPADADFPVPYLAGGPRPTLGTAQGVPPLPQGAIPPPVTATTTPPPAAAAADGPAAVPPVAPPTANAGAAAKPAKKPFKVDPALLERALKNKYAPQ